MTQNDLASTLESLHRNLADTPQIDEATALKLRMLIEELELVLAKSVPPSDPESTQQNLTDRIRLLIVDFETHHPRLTANLSLIAERLADMGI